MKVTKRFTKAQHRKRHEQLHKMLDELVADMILDTGLTPSRMTVMALMTWSHRQTKNPRNRRLEAWAGQ